MLQPCSGPHVKACLALLLSGFTLTAWTDDSRTASAPQATVSKSAVATLSARQSTLWARSCAFCHVDGNAGAPRMGHWDEWSARLAQGEAVLVRNTLEGLNNMPPLGYCMACETDDFRAMIRFMTANVTEGKQ